MRTGLIFDVSGMMTSIRWFTFTGWGTRCWRSISTVSASTEPGRCGDSLLLDTLTVWRWAQTAAWWPQSSPQLLLYQVESWFCDIEMMKKVWIDKSTYLKIFQLELKLKLYLSLENIWPTCDVSGCQVFALTHTDNTVDGVTLHSNGWILQPASPDKEFPPPELFSHSLNSGQKLYGMIYKPHNAVPGKRWEISCKETLIN